MTEYIKLGEYKPCSYEIKLYYDTDFLKKSLSNDKLRGEYMLTCYHEWIHYLQFLFSTFGRYLTFSLRYEAITALKIANDIVKDGNKIRIPLYQNFDRLNEEAKEKLYFNRLSVLCRNLLHGEQYLDPDYPLYYYSAERPSFSPNPIYVYDNKPFTISALQVIEGHANSAETDYLFITSKIYGYDMDDLSNILRSRHKKIDPYSIILYMISEKFDIEYFQGTFFNQLICDIALNPILDNNVPTIPWEDIHPGWRLKKCIDAALDLGCDITKLDKQEEIGRKICDYLNYDFPNHAIQSWLNVDTTMEIYDRDIQTLRSDKNFILGTPLVNIEALKEKFPVFQCLAENEGLGDEFQMRGVAFRQIFTILDKLSSFLFGNKQLNSEEKEILIQCNIFPWIDLERIFANLEENE